MVAVQIAIIKMGCLAISRKDLASPAASLVLMIGFLNANIISIAQVISMANNKKEPA